MKIIITSIEGEKCSYPIDDVLPGLLIGIKGLLEGIRGVI